MSQTPVQHPAPLSSRCGGETLTFIGPIDLLLNAMDEWTLSPQDRRNQRLETHRAYACSSAIAER